VTGPRGSPERFIKTLQVEWAYAASYQTHHHRATALRPWLEYYNKRRPHSALGHKPPASIIGTD
jgi:transposase InsO family protein